MTLVCHRQLQPVYVRAVKKYSTLKDRTTLDVGHATENTSNQKNLKLINTGVSPKIETQGEIKVTTAEGLQIVTEIGLTTDIAIIAKLNAAIT